MYFTDFNLVEIAQQMADHAYQDFQDTIPQHIAGNPCDLAMHTARMADCWKSWLGGAAWDRALDDQNVQFQDEYTRVLDLAETDKDAEAALQVFYDVADHILETLVDEFVVATELAWEHSIDAEIEAYRRKHAKA